MARFNIPESNTYYNTDSQDRIIDINIEGMSIVYGYEGNSKKIKSIDVGGEGGLEPVDLVYTNGKVTSGPGFAINYANGKVASVISDNKTIIYTYLPNGKLESANDGVNKSTFNYDGDDKPIAPTIDPITQLEDNMIRLTCKDNWSYSDGEIVSSEFSFTVMSTGEITVNWGDGTVETMDNLSNNGIFEHQYATNNGSMYTVLISSTATITKFYLNAHIMDLYQGGILAAELTTTGLTAVNYNEDDNLFGMFSACNRIKSIRLPSSLPLITNAGSMFNSCYRLQVITGLSGLSNVTNADSMFANCDEFTTVDISALTNITNADNMFNWCTNLAYIDISALSKATTAVGIFGYCTNLITVDVSPLSKITNAEGMFFNWSYAPDEFPNKLTTVTGLEDLVNVTNTNDMFGNCVNLVSVNLSGFTEVTTANSMFKKCILLTSVDLSAFTEITKANSMFSFCTSLTSVDVSAFTKVTETAGLFTYCESLTAIIGLSALSLVSKADHMFSGCKSLTSINVSGFSGITSASAMFFGTALQSITGLQSLTNIVDASFMFQECNALASIDVSFLANATNVDEIFHSCGVLTTITGMEELSSVTSANFMFADCESLTEIDVTSMVALTSATGMFSGCIDLTTITGLNGLINITSADSMFVDCTSLTSINISALTNISNANSMFNGCSVLTSIGSGITQFSFIDMVMDTNSGTVDEFTFLNTLIPFGGTLRSLTSVAITGIAIEGEELIAVPTPSNAIASYQWLISDTVDGVYEEYEFNSNDKTQWLGAVYGNSGPIGKFFKVVATGKSIYDGVVTSNPSSIIIAIPAYVLAFGEASNTAGNITYENNVEGTEIGQYTVGSIATFMITYNAANDMYNNRYIVPQATLEQMTADLLAAIAVFQAAKRVA